MLSGRAIRDQLDQMDVFISIYVCPDSLHKWIQPTVVHQVRLVTGAV